jgi:hypothetical protein
VKFFFISILVFFLLYFIFASSRSFKNEIIQVQVNCPELALTRNLLNLKTWNNWWPGNKENDTLFNLKKLKYSIEKLVINGVFFEVKSSNLKERGFLQITSINDTSSNLIWYPSTTTNHSLFQRLLHPFYKNELNSNIALLLNSIKNHFDSPINIYGFKLNITEVKDPHLISIKRNYLTYPTTESIYQTIEQLEKFAISKGARKTNAPMLNVHKSETNNSFNVLIALPVNIPLEESGIFSPKFMIQGVLLEAEIEGGALKVENSLAQFGNYLSDYKLSAPAIPFQTLISDRSKILDTNRWITKIYQPVFKK